MVIATKVLTHRFLVGSQRVIVARVLPAEMSRQQTPHNWNQSSTGLVTLMIDNLTDKLFGARFLRIVEELVDIG
ncbi:hypothetical protein LR1_01650 [Lacticaseibacillus rhamnosus DSM 20021 = JCM 1136 = NBRC 3425]|nr:hypothetical protein LR1_01650 [Lacticaseibacillus rhamnosus DSM 20021 = JCM 1136 = NBRC 3425]